MVLLLLFSLTIFQITYQLNIKLDITERCIFHDLYSINNLVNYKIYGIDDLKEMDLQTTLSMIKIRLYNTIDKEYVTQLESPKYKEGKFPIIESKISEILICVFLHYDLQKEIGISLEVTSKHTGIPDIEDPLNSEHIEDMHLTLKSTINSVSNAIYGFEDELKLEEKDAFKIQKSTKFFYFLTLGQIVIILIFFLYQLYKAREVIKSINNIY